MTTVCIWPSHTGTRNDSSYKTPFGLGRRSTFSTERRPPFTVCSGSWVRIRQGAAGTARPCFVPAPRAWCSAGSSGRASRGPGKAHALPRVAVGAGSWLGRLKREQPQHEEQLLVASPLLCAPRWAPRARPKSRRPRGRSVTTGARTSLARPPCAGSAPLLGPYNSFFRFVWSDGRKPADGCLQQKRSVPEAGRW